MFMRYNRCQTKQLLQSYPKILEIPADALQRKRGISIMKNVKKLAALLLAAGMTMSMASCASAPASSSNSGDTSTNSAAGESPIDKIKAAGKIIMATNAQFEPFEYIDGTDFKGIDIEISQKIADELGVELEIHDVKFESVIAEITTGKANFAAAGLTIDEDRKKNVDFSEPYYNTTQVILVRSDETEIKSSKDLKGKTVGAQTGTVGDDYATDKDGEYGHGVAEVKRYNSFMDAANDLMAGRIDAVVMDDFPADKIVEKNPDKLVKLDEKLTGEDYALAVPKGDKEMKELVDKVLADLEESGELKEIVNSYME